ncbi:helix-turn-helix transcriptional regulator, partial [Candidatus Woesearchaeota archaeon]|nr:helix-turn-helix transcriptional regulator [Candidatus Woesearchaeota archaeon]
MAWKPDEIKDLREALGLTQAKFAKKLKTQRTRVTKWETGKESPSEFYQKKLDQLRGESGCTTAFISKIEEAEKYIVSGNEPESPLTGSLYQSQENYAWTKEAIQSFRRVKGWTQAQLAQACATAQQIVAQWETGKFSPDYEHQLKLDQLANFLVFQRQMKESSLSALQKRLNALDIPLELFKQYTKLVANRRWQYIMDKGDGWFEAKRTKDGEPWPAPDTQIADHLAGHVWEGTATRDYIFQT